MNKNWNKKKHSWKRIKVMTEWRNEDLEENKMDKKHEIHKEEIKINKYYLERKKEKHRLNEKLRLEENKKEIESKDLWKEIERPKNII